jgi:hypothetical protein
MMRGMWQQAQQEGFQLHVLELVLSADQDAGAYEVLEVQTVHAVVGDLVTEASEALAVPLEPVPDLCQWGLSAASAGWLW